jgi:hypothetical protein
MRGPKGEGGGGNGGAVDPLFEGALPSLHAGQPSIRLVNSYRRNGGTAGDDIFSRQHLYHSPGG